MRQQRSYDALVLFSDFQDGVTQYRIKGEKADTNVQGGGYPIIYYDGVRADVARGSDARKPVERRWEEEWLKSFSDAKDGKGPRLYCFSTEQEPQQLLSKCVLASGGQIKMVTWLKTGGLPRKIRPRPRRPPMAPRPPPPPPPASRCLPRRLTSRLVKGNPSGDGLQGPTLVGPFVWLTCRHASRSTFDRRSPLPALVARLPGLITRARRPDRRRRLVRRIPDDLLAARA